jgi:drug/metabolite transporter (DMT)-like permease
MSEIFAGRKPHVAAAIVPLETVPAARRLTMPEVCAEALLWRPSFQVQALLALITANVIWGTTFVATKPMLERIPPLTIAAGRFTVALLVLLPILWWRGSRPTLGRSTALLGFTGVFLVYACQNVGLGFTSATNGALIHGGIPVLTALIAVPMLGERLNRRNVLGIMLSIAGVVVLVLLGNGGALTLSLVGDALILLSALALATYLVLGRRAFPHGGALELVSGVACFGFLFLLPAAAIELALTGAQRPTGGDVAGLLYLGGLASALAFILWAFGLRHFQAGQAAIFTNLSPLVGVVVAALLLRESVSSVQVGTGAVIVGGVWLATRRAVTGPLTSDEAT